MKRIVLPIFALLLTSLLASNCGLFQPIAVTAPDTNGFIPIFASPEIRGTQVTFRFYNTNTNIVITNVVVRGTFSSWDAFSNFLLASNASTGIWEGSIEIRPGTYSYKFYVNWNGDPKQVSSPWFFDIKNFRLDTLYSNSVLIVPPVVQTNLPYEIRILEDFDDPGASARWRLVSPVAQKGIDCYVTSADSAWGTPYSMKIFLDSAVWKGKCLPRIKLECITNLDLSGFNGIGFTVKRSGFVDHYQIGFSTNANPNPDEDVWYYAGGYFGSDWALCTRDFVYLENPVYTLSSPTQPGMLSSGSDVLRNIRKLVITIPNLESNRIYDGDASVYIDRIFAYRYTNTPFILDKQWYGYGTNFFEIGNVNPYLGISGSDVLLSENLLAGTWTSSNQSIIFRFTSDGRPVTNFRTNGLDLKNLCPDQYGNTYVLSWNYQSNYSQILKLDSNLSLLSVFSYPTNQISGMGIDTNLGVLYVQDVQLGKILRLGTNGVPTGFSFPNPNHGTVLSELVVDSAGNFYFMENFHTTTTEILKYNSSGTLLRTIVLTNLLPQTLPWGCKGLAVDSSSNVYIGDFQNSRIVVIAPDNRVLYNRDGLSPEFNYLRIYDNVRAFAIDSSGAIFNTCQDSAVFWHWKIQKLLRNF